MAEQNQRRLRLKGGDWLVFDEMAGHFIMVSADGKTRRRAKKAEWSPYQDWFAKRYAEAGKLHGESGLSKWDRFRSSFMTDQDGFLKALVNEGAIESYETDGAGRYWVTGKDGYKRPVDLNSGGFKALVEDIPGDLMDVAGYSLPAAAGVAGEIGGAAFGPAGAVVGAGLGEAAGEGARQLVGGLLVPGVGGENFAAGPMVASGLAAGAAPPAASAFSRNVYPRVAEKVGEGARGIMRIPAGTETGEQLRRRAADVVQPTRRVAGREFPIAPKAVSPYRKWVETIDVVDDLSILYDQLRRGADGAIPEKAKVAEILGASDQKVDLSEALAAYSRPIQQTEKGSSYKVSDRQIEVISDIIQTEGGIYRKEALTNAPGRGGAPATQRTTTRTGGPAPTQRDLTGANPPRGTGYDLSGGGVEDTLIPPDPMLGTGRRAVPEPGTAGGSIARESMSREAIEKWVASASPEEIARQLKGVRIQTAQQALDKLYSYGYRTDPSTAIPLTDIATTASRQAGDSVKKIIHGALDAESQGAYTELMGHVSKKLQIMNMLEPFAGIVQYDKAGNPIRRAASGYKPSGESVSVRDPEKLAAAQNKVFNMFSDASEQGWVGFFKLLDDYFPGQASSINQQTSQVMPNSASWLDAAQDAATGVYFGGFGGLGKFGRPSWMPRVTATGEIMGTRQVAMPKSMVGAGGAAGAGALYGGLGATASGAAMLGGAALFSQKGTTRVLNTIPMYTLDPLLRLPGRVLDATRYPGTSALTRLGMEANMPETAIGVGQGVYEGVRDSVYYPDIERKKIIDLGR